MRIGIGFDLHRVVPMTALHSIPMGGVTIPAYFQIQAHSDGDVLLHALTDACLGALALGDIGQWFPDTSPENRGKPSAEFLQKVLREVNRLGWRVTHVDTNLFLEEPKIAPHSEAIRRNLATLLGVDLSQVSVKAKTMEGLGPIGHREAIAAQALVTLECLSK